MTWGADIDAKVDGLFGSINRAPPRGTRVPSKLDKVPRPVRPPQPGKIDISNAPSAMEELAKKWSGR